MLGILFSVAGTAHENLRQTAHEPVWAFCASSLGKLATGIRASWATSRGSPDRAVGGRVECAVPPSICHFPVRKVLTGARSFSRSGCVQRQGSFLKQKREQKRRASRDTTVVARRVWVAVVTAVTVYLVLILMVPSQKTRTLEMISLVVVCARSLAVAAVASHTCLPPSLSAIVTKSGEFLVQAAARVNAWMPTLWKRVRVFVAIYCPRFCRRAADRAEGERRELQRGGVFGLNGSANGETSA